MRKKQNKQSINDGDEKFWFWLSFSLLCLFVFVLNNNLIEENDTWWHIRMGQWMVENKAIMREEVFSVTAGGKPIVAYQWLAQIFFYFLAGSTGIVLSLFKLVLMVGGSAIVFYKLAKPYWNGKFTFWILMALAFLMAFRAQVRPHLIGMWCSLLLVVAAIKWFKSFDLKKLWWMLPVQIIWANSHASFMVAPVLLIVLGWGVFIIQKFPILPGDKKTEFPPNAFMQPVYLALALLAVSFINPFGVDLVLKPIKMYFTHNYMREYIREWHSIIDLLPGNWYILWFAWMGTLATVLFKRRTEITTVELGFSVLAFILPFTGVRYVTLSALLSAPIFLKHAFALAPNGFDPRKSTFFTVPLILIIGYLGYPQSYEEFRSPGLGLNLKQAPLALVEHIKVHKLTGIMMNQYNDGAYAIYYLFPEVKTVMDSRTEIYGQKLFEEHNYAYSSPDAFKSYVDKYHVNLAMIKISNRPLRGMLFNDPEWTLEKTGLTFDLFSRRQNTDLNVDMVQFSKVNSKGLDAESKYCLFVRLYGYCFKAPECKTECEMNDPTIAALLKLPNPLCIKFLQACRSVESGCKSNCAAFCSHYKWAAPKLNKRLGTDLPPAVDCR